MYNSAMQITDIRLRTLRIEKLIPYANAFDVALQDEFVTTIVEISTDEGITGILACQDLDDMSVDIIVNQLGPKLEGEDPRNYERIWQKLFGHEGGWRVPHHKGEVVRAISVIDCALWDIVGKACRQPVSRLLGGFRSRIACYASGGHYYSFTSHQDDLVELELEMHAYMEMGFRAVKICVGRDLDQDMERARLARSVIGPETQLLFNFDAAASRYGGVPHALKSMRALEELNPFWFEDPLVIDDLAGLQKLTASIDTTIATGGNEQTIWGFREIISKRACDVIIPDATQTCGGITEWRKIAALAHAFRIPVAANSGDPVHLNCISGVANGLLIEIFTPRDWKRVGYQKDASLMPDADGCVAITDLPGLGIDLNEEFIGQHLL